MSSFLSFSFCDLLEAYVFGGPRSMFFSISRRLRSRYTGNTRRKHWPLSLKYFSVARTNDKQMRAANLILSLLGVENLIPQ